MFWQSFCVFITALHFTVMQFTDIKSIIILIS